MRKTAKGLVKYAKAQLGNPYWYGTFGQKSSKELYLQKKAQYPSYYTANDYKKQYGKKVHDCIGLIKGYLWCASPEDEYPVYLANGCPDINEEMMYSFAEVKGSIASMPDVSGVLVFMQGHVGVYIGDGKVIEARGHAYGVVKTSLAQRNWTKWCLCPYISYEDVLPAKKPNSTKKPTVKVSTNGSVLNCRKKPTVISKILGTFKNGTTLTLKSKKNKKWYYVSGKATNGKTLTGYVSTKWIKE